VVIGARRGAVRVWRRADEKWVKSCVRSRWKGCSEFMFWGAFSYELKGPCQIWEAETAKEKKAAQVDIERRNAELEPIKRREWEFLNGMRRLALRNLPGPKPTRNFIKETGKLVRRPI
jgi:hypothetical protein